MGLRLLLLGVRWREPEFQTGPDLQLIEYFEIWLDLGDEPLAGVRRKPPPEMLTRIEMQHDRVSARPLRRSDEVHAPVAEEGLRDGRDLPEPGFVPTLRSRSDGVADDRGHR